MAAILVLRALVSGRVQGVGFRWATREAAERIGVRGWVRNLADGRVEAVISGTPEQLEKMQEFLRRGPSMARVDDLTVETAAPDDVPEGFEIRH